MRLRSALVGLAALALPLLVASPARAACTTTTKTLSGTIGGEDGWYVDALLGFDVMDRNGAHLDGRTPGSSSYGCGGFHGYGVFTRINRTLPATGSTTQGTKQWTVTLPGNTAFVHIEVYPYEKEYGGVSEAKYGHSYRRKVPVPYGTAVNIRLPLVCKAGGTTGGISGWVKLNGVKTTADFIGAWTLVADNNRFQPIMGWNMGTSNSTGYYLVPNLPSGQTYIMQAIKNGHVSYPRKTYVAPCKNTYTPIDFTF
jgi:hypothetical protein